MENDLIKKFNGQIQIMGKGGIEEMSNNNCVEHNPFISNVNSNLNVNNNQNMNYYMNPNYQMFNNQIYPFNYMNDPLTQNNNQNQFIITNTNNTNNWPNNNNNNEQNIIKNKRNKTAYNDKKPYNKKDHNKLIINAKNIINTRNITPIKKKIRNQKTSVDKKTEDNKTNTNDIFPINNNILQIPQSNYITPQPLYYQQPIMMQNNLQMFPNLYQAPYNLNNNYNNFNFQNNNNIDNLKNVNNFNNLNSNNENQKKNIIVENSPKNKDSIQYHKYIEYRPYNLKDYKELAKPSKMGGLGANIGTKEWEDKKNRMKKMQNYSNNINKEHKGINTHKKDNIVDELKKKAKEKIENSKRHRTYEYGNLIRKCTNDNPISTNNRKNDIHKENKNNNKNINKDFKNEININKSNGFSSSLRKKSDDFEKLSNDIVDNNNEIKKEDNLNNNLNMDINYNCLENKVENNEIGNNEQQNNIEYLLRKKEEYNEKIKNIKDTLLD